jgi:hydroxyacylglutathione hydrolase
MSELTGLANERLRLVQMLCGEDLASEQTAKLATDEQQKSLKKAIFQGAAQSANFIYLIIDRETNACACVDACWDTEGLLHIIHSLELELVAALYTHRHSDHTGGRYSDQVRLEGLSNLAISGVPTYVGDADVESTVEQCALGEMVPRVRGLSDGDIIQVGGLQVRAILTAGHTPGGVCYAVGGDDISGDADVEAIITGDTLFVGAFGRVDLDHSDPDAMFESLQRLSRLPDRVAVLPGHNYGSARMSRIGDERATNVGFRCRSRQQFRILSGAGTISPPPFAIARVDR